mgnify:CR=1 FL=1
MASSLPKSKNHLERFYKLCQESIGVLINGSIFVAKHNISMSDDGVVKIKWTDSQNTMELIFDNIGNQNVEVAFEDVEFEGKPIGQISLTPSVNRKVVNGLSVDIFPVPAVMVSWSGKVQFHLLQFMDVRSLQTGE